METFLIFCAVFLGALFLLSFWAQIFAGSWQRVSFQDEVPNALILSVILTSLAVVLRSAPRGRARVLIALGLATVALEVFLELPLKKYVALVPSTPIRSWFFLFGMTEFIGIMLTLVGVTALLRELKRKP